MKDFNFPFAFDKVTNKSSATLFFTYLSFWQTFILILVLSVKDSLLNGLIASFILYIISIFIYRARKIDSLKFSKDGFQIGGNSKDDTAVEEETVEENKKQVLNEKSENVEGWGSASAKSN